MNTTLDNVLNSLARPGVDYNFQDMNYTGALFSMNPDMTVSAVVAAAPFIIEIENTQIKPEGEFFNFASNKWTQSPYPLQASAILERMRSYNFTGKFIVPFTNLINHLNKLEDNIKKKSRVVMVPTVMEQGDMLMTFKDQGGKKVFTHKLLPKACIINENSPYPASEVKSVVYRCKIVGETSENYIVDVIEEYGKVKLGLHYSDCGFIPTYMDSVNKLTTVPYPLVMRVNAIEPEKNFNMPPVHLDCKMMYDLVRVFGLLPTTYIEISFGDNPNAPVLIRNVKNSSDDLQINIIVGTLNPYYGAQRR